ncbi:TetR family transcriptional regulator [Maribrevibacterium harenarium]|uniref:TetR family transcriptional regulator n=1 Tax=Maribrevibacterium harenarium TaxID=2589817 RepID=A0A501W3H5_9GAMM|nr:TetR family transcriptional regulator C-terminal domain-containing protein [Maribrevibacterium harenarium]TPE44149.1 TetR family transcriptional regulator [Maribrevibacterium harenarium]
MTEVTRRRGRPKSKPDANEDTQEALLQAGLAWLTEHGFTGSSLESILRSVNVPKGSFYHYYRSKEAFGLAVLERYRKFFEYKLDKHLLNEQLAPLDRMQAFMDDAIRGLEKHQFERGCLIGNLEQEVHALPISFRDAIEATYASWQQRVSACLRLAQLQGHIPLKHCPDDLAHVFWLGWEGAVTRSRLHHSVAPLRAFGQFFLQSVGH